MWEEKVKAEFLAGKLSVWAAIVRLMEIGYNEKLARQVVEGWSK